MPTGKIPFIRAGAAGACEVGYFTEWGGEVFRVIPDASPLQAGDRLTIHTDGGAVVYSVNGVPVERWEATDADR